MKKQTKTFSGRLTYSDLAQYELVSRNGVFNISKILDQVYHSNKNYIEIEILDGYKSIYKEQGNLVFKKDIDGVYGYHINGNCLDSLLFYNTDKLLGIEIFAETLDTLRNGEIAYDRQENAK